jgi:hypothetical protein
VIDVNHYSIYSNSPHCLFLDNNARISGGAINVFFQSAYTYSAYCIFKNNLASIGGALNIDS